MFPTVSKTIFRSFSQVGHIRGKEVVEASARLVPSAYQPGSKVGALRAPPRGPYAQHDGADHDQDTQTLKTGRVVVAPENDGCDADRRGKDGEKELHQVLYPFGQEPPSPWVCVCVSKAMVDGPGHVPHRVAMRLASLLALLILVPACGGSAQAAPTRAEFIRQGDAVCAEIQQELGPIRARAEAARRLPERDQLGLLTRMWDDQIRLQKRFVEDMKAIGTPAGDNVAEELIDSLEHGVKLAEDVQDGFEDEDAGAISKALPAYLNFTVTLNSRVATYGFRRCGAGV